MIKKISLAIVIIILLGLAGIYFGRNILTEKAVESGSSYALGVDTDLGSAGLELGGGSVELNDFKISNPDGFETDNFLTIKHGLLDVDAGSVLDDEVIVDSLVIEGLKLTIEQIEGRGNYKELLDHAGQIDFGSSSKDEQKFKIKQLSLRDINVAAAVTLLGKKQIDKTFTLKDITLTDIGGSDGASIAELTTIITKTLVSKAASSGQGISFEQLEQNTRNMINENLHEKEKEVGDKLKDIGKGLLGN